MLRDVSTTKLSVHFIKLFQVCTSHFSISPEYLRWGDNTIGSKFPTIFVAFDEEEEAISGFWREVIKGIHSPRTLNFLKGRHFLRCSVWALIKQSWVHMLLLILQGWVGFWCWNYFGTVSSWELVCKALSVGLRRGARGIIKKGLCGLVLFWVTLNPKRIPAAWNCEWQILSLFHTLVFCRVRVAK